MILVRKWSEKASGLRREIFSVDFSRRVSKQKLALSLAFFWSRAAILIACHALFFNSRTAIAGAIIGLLLVFYDSKRSIGFLKVFFFLPEVLFVQTMF